MQNVDILLIDDHGAMRRELVSLLDAQDGLQVVGQADNGEDGVRLAIELQPDIIVMDVVMPRMNGIDATRAVRTALPDTRVLGLSNHSGQHLVEELRRAGASGYLRKDRAYEELVPAILAIVEDRPYFGEDLGG